MDVPMLSLGGQIITKERKTMKASQCSLTRRSYEPPAGKAKRDKTNLQSSGGSTLINSRKSKGAGRKMAGRSSLLSPQSLDNSSLTIMIHQPTVILGSAGRWTWCSGTTGGLHSGTM